MVIDKDQGLAYQTKALRKQQILAGEPGCNISN